MKEISSDIRKAVIDAITPLNLAGITIPVKDSFLNPNVTPATYLGGQAYVLITDQDENETTNNDCSLRQNVRLTIDIVTKFPSGSGGKKASEDISNFIQENIVLGNISIFSSWQILNIRKDFSRSIIEQGSTQVAFRKLISYTFDIFEL
jgi:hypothetical protein